MDITKYIEQKYGENYTNTKFNVVSKNVKMVNFTDYYKENYNDMKVDLINISKQITYNESTTYMSETMVYEFMGYTFVFKTKSENTEDYNFNLDYVHLFSKMEKENKQYNDFVDLIDSIIVPKNEKSK